jgi:C2H2-type zinc finger/zinc-finger C2H2-type
MVGKRAADNGSRRPDMLMSELAGRNPCPLSTALLQNLHLLSDAQLQNLHISAVQAHEHRISRALHNILYPKPQLQFYTCWICALEFERGIQLGQHLENIHGMRDAVILNPGYMCDNPNTETAAASAKPPQTTPTSKNHQCKICSRKFTTTNFLKRHVQTVHERRRSFQCDICGGMFATDIKLRRHVDEMHLNIRPFQCSICEKTFVNNFALRRHMEVVHLRIVGLFLSQQRPTPLH